MSTMRKVAIRLGGVSVVGGGIGAAMYRRRLEENRAVSATVFNKAQDPDRLQHALSLLKGSFDHSRSVGSKARVRPGVIDGLKVDLFRYTTCPFCGKAKAFMDYYGVPYQQVEVEPMFKKELSGSTYKKLPQIRFSGADGAEAGVYLVDSDEIVDTLAPLFGASGQLQDPDINRWRSWCRESLVRHITLNFNKSLTEAWQGYGYIDNFDTIPYSNKLFLKVVGAPVMFLVAKYKTLPTLEAAGEIRPGDDFREVLHRELNRYVSESKIDDVRLFHGGVKPDLADLDIYGVLQSVRGHRVYDDVMRSTRLAPWLNRMDRETGQDVYTLVEAFCTAPERA